MGEVFRKTCSILGLDYRKSRWVVEKDFHVNFRVNVTWFFAFFFSDRIVLVLVWFASLCTSYRAKLSLTIKTGDITSGRKDVDPHTQLQVAQEQMG